MKREAIVVGGGPAGAATAAHLAAAGRRVLLIEREEAPRHKVCGEFVSIEARAALEGLGVDLAALGAAPIGSLRLVSGHAQAEAALPFEAVGLTRRALDEALLLQAQRRGATLERGVRVTRVRAGEGGLEVETAGARLAAPAVFLATGKHGLRGFPRPPPRPADLVGFKIHFELCAPQRRALEGHVEIVLFAGGYAGLQLVEGGIANLCLLARRDLVQARRGAWPDILAHLLDGTPHLARRLRGAAALFDKPLAIAGIPYGFVHDGTADPPGLYRLGDQAAVIPSFCGDGLAIALHSAAMAAACHCDGKGPGAFHAALRARVSRQIGFATSLERVGRTVLGRNALVALGRAFPALLAAAASATRLPGEADSGTRMAGLGAARPLAR